MVRSYENWPTTAFMLWIHLVWVWRRGKDVCHGNGPKLLMRWSIQQNCLLVEVGFCPSNGPTSAPVDQLGTLFGDSMASLTRCVCMWIRIWKVVESLPYIHMLLQMLYIRLGNLTEMEGLGLLHVELIWFSPHIKTSEENGAIASPWHVTFDFSWVSMGCFNECSYFCWQGFFWIGTSARLREASLDDQGQW